MKELLRFDLKLSSVEMSGLEAASVTFVRQDWILKESGMTSESRLSLGATY